MASHRPMARDELFQAVFRSGDIDADRLESYVSYYNRQRQAARSKGAQVDSDGIILETIVQAQTQTRQTMIDTGVSRATLDLVARAMTMHATCCWNFDNEKDSDDSWAPDETLRDCISRRHTMSINNEHVKLERSFSARALEHVASFHVMWTDNLLDHLKIGDLDEHRQYVFIFHHATFLDLANPELFPPHFLDETARTLALLFPFKDQKTLRWFNKHVKRREKNSLDPAVLRYRPLELRQRDIGEFHYWRDRLINLKKAYDASEPGTVSQWWFDRRRKVQWATFWVAALVLFLNIIFGLAQTIEGALQAYKAYNPSPA